jgi:hypothetical protein
MSSNKTQNKRQGKGRNTNVDSLIVTSHHAAARGDYLFDAADLSRTRLSWSLTQSPPKNFLTQPHWIQSTFETAVAVSAAGSVVESNQGFSLTQFPDAASIAALFDQYCIYAVSSRATVDPSASSAVPGVDYGEIYSALDFDSSSALSTVVAIQRFGSCIQSQLVLGKSYERFVKPCVAVITGASNSTSNTGLGMQRLWLNSVSNSVPHFGVRFLTATNQSGTSVTLRLVHTAVFGLRNNI